MLNYNNELDEALENLLEVVQNKEDDVFFRNNMASVKETYYMHSSDPIIKKVLSDLTKFAAQLFIWEMKQPVSDADLQKYKTTNNTCCCQHWCYYLLPCRHIMQLKRISGERECWYCSMQVGRR